MDNRLLQEIDLTQLPVHIAIIMDGNGRWAKKQGLSRIYGHQNGVTSIRDIVKFCAEIGVKYLTLYAFSTENWARPKHEVKKLMSLLEEYLVKELPTFIENNIRFKTIGLIDGLPPVVQDRIKENIERTTNNTGLTLNLALNYSGRSEISDSIRRIAVDVHNGSLRPEDIDESTISGYLFTSGMPDPDLLIRTSGEMRISNFLLWQISYTELWITDVLWPEFRREHLVDAIKAYQSRERRFGKV
ncbi:MAG: isoprenyl transferase [Candidatus Auribacterota bacterium]|jgi:undecaprenyl diphosphate synthase|nr:isoprenyl transferase [Candidatus Auribacterota bacterium]